MIGLVLFTIFIGITVLCGLGAICTLRTTANLLFDSDFDVFNPS